MKIRYYCSNKECPITDCEKHINQADKRGRFVYLASYYRTCRRYIKNLVDEILEQRS